MRKKPTKSLIIPTFASESEDAAWHDAHKRKLEAEMARRIRGRKTFSLAEAMTRARQTHLRPVTIRLAPEDIDAARELAAEKGIGYQTYIRMILRESLQQRARKQR